MKQYSNKISLVKNRRGVWDLDPFKGCFYGTQNNPKGCYGICYAYKIAKFRGYDFTKVVYRDFIDEKHLQEIGKQLQKVPFVRLGTMCDPSHDWGHTLKIIDKIRPFQKNIVIITKHWTTLTKSQLQRLNGICVNTSISILDTEEQIRYRLKQYNRLKPYCKSVLRVNTCNFIDNLFFERSKLQNELLSNEKVIDNVLRFPKSNKLSVCNVIKVKKCKFMDTDVMASIYNKNTHLGFCEQCEEQCGINL